MIIIIIIATHTNNNEDLLALARVALLARALAPALALAEVVPVLVESLADEVADHLIKKITNNSSCDDLFGSNVIINSKDLKDVILGLGHGADSDEHVDSCTCHVDEVNGVVPLRLGVVGLVNN